MLCILISETDSFRLYARSQVTATPYQGDIGNVVNNRDERTEYYMMFDYTKLYAGFYPDTLKVVFAVLKLPFLSKHRTRISKSHNSTYLRENNDI